ncbi:MAG: hypothetical protein IKT95_05155 [Spirochaetales bacterium]|nr:hypothetical protein [Spirochaetales bacterium]
MKTRIIVLLLTVLLCAGLVSCASTDAGSAAAETQEVRDLSTYAVVVDVDGVQSGYDTLEAAVKAVKKGQTATVTVQQDLELKKSVEVIDKTITITDAGTPVTIKDAVAMENYVEYNGNDVVVNFKIQGKGKLILKGTETGGITFLGAGASASVTKRIMFYIGIGWKEPATEISGYLEFNKGITVTNISSTIFGGLVRAYGELVINGGVFTQNYVKGNGLFTCYDKTTINDCEVTFNDTANVGIFQLCSIDGLVTVVNGGLYENNTSAKRAAVFNTYAKGSFILNGGTFRNNTVYAEGAGGAIYIVSENQINGGTFENNSSCDIFIDKAAVAGLKKADSVNATVIQGI